ncbi:portal protein, partial [Bacillus wiedmannii]
TLYPDLEEEVRIENLTKPMFVYFKPNTANNFDMSSPLGISIYANALGTLKSLDIAFDSFQREFVLGKKRIIVPDMAIKTVADPLTGTMLRYFDANDEVYQAFQLGDNTNQIQDISVEL